tara:strand:+ start:217 stop:768 length:552 start_codon:yes stop_codon:yes gene_type:complete
LEISLNHKLSEIQTKFKSKKSRFNSFGKYYFRSAEDILEAVKPFLLEYDVTVKIKEKYLGDYIIKTTAIISDSIQRIKATAIVGVDTNQKGMQMPQRFGSASSYGKKYALGNLFLIDDTQDADATNKHIDYGQENVPKKVKLLKDTPSYNKVVKAMKNGYSLNDVKGKFILNDDIEQTLKQIK